MGALSDEGEAEFVAKGFQSLFACLCARKRNSICQTLLQVSRKWEAVSRLNEVCERFLFLFAVDVEHSHVRFLGNLVLNLWDCGG